VSRRTPYQQRKMHSIWTRLNSLFFYSLTALFLLAAGSYVT
jgi:hypothetical protein